MGASTQGQSGRASGSRAPAVRSEAGQRLLAGPVLDLGLAEDEVEEQARHGDSRREQEGVSPAQLRVLLAGNRRLVTVPSPVPPGLGRL